METKGCVSCDWLVSTFASQIAAGAKYQCSHCGKIVAKDAPASPPAVAETAHAEPEPPATVLPPPIAATPIAGTSATQDLILQKIDWTVKVIIAMLSLIFVIHFCWMHYKSMSIMQSRFDKLETCMAKIGSIKYSKDDNLIRSNDNIYYYYKVNGFVYHVELPYCQIRYEIDQRNDLTPVEGELSNRVYLGAEFTIHYAKDQPFFHFFGQSRSYATWQDRVWYKRGVIGYIRSSIIPWIYYTFAACMYYASLRRWAMTRAVPWRRLCLMLVAGIPIVTGGIVFHLSDVPVKLIDQGSDYIWLARCHATTGSVVWTDRHESGDYVYRYNISGQNYTNNNNINRIDEQPDLPLVQRRPVLTKDGEPILVLYNVRDPSVSTPYRNGISLRISGFDSYADVFGTEPYSVTINMFGLGVSVVAGFFIGWIPGFIAWVASIAARQWRGTGTPITPA